MCDWCELARSGYLHEYYLNPFNDNVYEFELCNNCNDKLEQDGYERVHMCEACLRYIRDDDGRRIFMRYHEPQGGYVCVSCLQNKWLIHGMDKFSEADFFAYSELTEAGFNKHSSYFCRAKKDYEDAEIVFKALQESGNSVIVDIERSGMGLEHHIGLWYKESE